jgi:type III secretion protein I
MSLPVQVVQTAFVQPAIAKTAPATLNPPSSQATEYFRQLMEGTPTTAAHGIDAQMQASSVTDVPGVDPQMDASSAITPHGTHPIDPLVSRVQNYAEDMHSRRMNVFAALDRKDLSMGEMLSLQMKVLDISVQYDLVSKCSGKSTQNFEQITNPK